MMFDLPMASSPSDVGVAEPKCHTKNLALFSAADTARRRAIPSARVLLADDNYFSRQKLSEAFKLTREFVICGEAVNGRDVIKAAQLLRPDLIVLDLVMPAMNGLVAAQALKRLMPKVPLILYGCLGKLVKQRAKALRVAALISETDLLDGVVNLARSLLAPKAAAAGSIATCSTSSMIAAA